VTSRVNYRKYSNRPGDVNFANRGLIRGKKCIQVLWVIRILVDAAANEILQWSTSDSKDNFIETRDSGLYAVFYRADATVCTDATAEGLSIFQVGVRRNSKVNARHVGRYPIVGCKRSSFCDCESP